MLANDFLKKDDRTFTPTSTRSAWYFTIFVVTKLCKCIGIFFIDVLVKQVHVITLLWMLKICSSCILVPVQKPFTTGKTIRRSMHVRIFQLAFINTLLEIVWLYGITFCGPFRAILIYEQSPAVIVVALMALIKGNSTSARSRGVFCLLAGFMILFIMDSDSTKNIIHADSHKHHGGLNHVFYHIISWFGISDHNGGILLLTITLLLRMGYDSSFRQLAVEIGGSKRLHSMISPLTIIFLTPFSVLAFFFSSSFVPSYMEFFIYIMLATLFVMVIEPYAASMCFQHVADPELSLARWAPLIMFSTSLIISWFWYESPIPISPESINQGHAISAGVVIATFLFCYATYILTSNKTPRSVAGHFIGISEEGVPLYTHGEAFLQKTSRSALRFCRETINEILSNTDSRQIFWFLCANLAFCGVEFVYGFLTNSLGLISDGFHMLFDCSALVMGLVASVMARWTASRFYSYGYGRVEVLSGFINALFLIVIAFFIFMEALERLYDPPNIQTDKLMFVAIAGLCVNLFGMYAFHGATHGHSHAGDHGHSHGSKTQKNTECDDSHSHSHSHGHSHGGGNANMRGVFLHVLADTLGSVFVIISTLLIQWFGWQWVDPLCSLILSVLILGSVCPLLESSASVLLQSVPDEIHSKLDEIAEEIHRLEGVVNHSNFHIWQLKSGINVASVHVEINNEVNEQIVRQCVAQILRQHGATHITVQIEKAFNLVQHTQQINRSDNRQVPLSNGALPYIGINVGSW